MVNPLRFSLATLVGVILLVSVYLAALRQSSAWGTELALTLTIGLLTAGLLWALFRPGANRWFWIGFELAGWSYLLLAFSDWSQGELSRQLLTTHLVTELHQMMPIANPHDVMVEWHGSWYAAEVLQRSGSKYFIHYQGYGANWDEWIGPERIRGHLGPFLFICHALLSLVAALFGGAIAGCLGAASRSRRWFWTGWAGCTSAVLGLGLWGIAFDSELAASAAVSLSFVVLLLSALAAWLGTGSQRSFALAFAIVGCGYFLLHFGPGLETAIGPNLLSTHLLNQVHDWLHPDAEQVIGSPLWSYGQGPFTGTYVTSQMIFRSDVRSATTTVTTLMLAGHALICVLLSLLSGFAALGMSRWPGAATKEKPTGTTEPTASTP